MDYRMFQRKYLLGCLGKLGEVQSNSRLQPGYHFTHSFLFFSVSFSKSLACPGKLCSNACQHMLHIVGLSQAEV